MTHDPFTGLQPSPPRPELRARVLMNARRAAVGSTTSPFDRLVDRLWASRALRIAWVAAAVLLVVANFRVGSGGWRADEVRAEAVPQPNTVEVDVVSEVLVVGILEGRSGPTLASVYPTNLIEELGL